MDTKVSSRMLLVLLGMMVVANAVLFVKNDNLAAVAYVSVVVFIMVVVIAVSEMAGWCSVNIYLKKNGGIKKVLPGIQQGNEF